MIKKIYTGGDLIWHLKDYGVEYNDLENILSLSFTKGRMDNNIRNLTEEDVMKILDEIY